MNTQYIRRAFAPAMIGGLLIGALSIGVAFSEESASDKSTATKVASKATTAKKAGSNTKGKEAPAEAKSLLGISILGNQEAPKALVIVPWKSSQLGDAQDISKMLDDSRQPVDKEVFMRELGYYEIRSGGK